MRWTGGRGRVAVVLPSVVCHVLAGGLLGCDAPEDPAESPEVELAAQAPPVGGRPADGFFYSAPLVEVVGQQLRRDREALREALEHPVPALRARAAFAMASVQDPASEELLLSLLGDPDPAVRADAAFALGQIPSSDGGETLVSFLEAEEDAVVREELWAALGKVAGPVGAGIMTQLPRGEGDAGSRAWGIARVLSRGVEVAATAGELVDLIGDESGVVRTAAAWGLASRPPAGNLPVDPEALREVLTGLDLDDPALPWLLLALGDLSGPGAVQWFLPFLREGPEWRVRHAAASALGRLQGAAEVPEVRQALLAALEDNSGHVAIEAAEVLRAQVAPRELVDLLPEWLDPSRPHWRGAVPLLPALAEEGRTAELIRWTEGVEDAEARARGVRALAEAAAVEAEELFFAEAGSSDSRVRVEAFKGIVALVPLRAGEPRVMERSFSLLADEVRHGPARSALVAAEGLNLDPFPTQFRSGSILEEALALRHMDPEEGFIRGLASLLGESGHEGGIPFLEALLGHGLHRVRVAAAVGLEAARGQTFTAAELREPERDRVVDGPTLAQFGSRPRLVMETTRGRLEFALDAQQAPYTVLQFAEQVGFGRHDGTWIHAVVPATLVGGGDVGIGDGTGGPGYAMRSEYTRIPFERGVLGMAAEGKDTEGSRWFATLARRPEMDGRFTAFGWLVSGWDVLDTLMEGDEVVRVQIIPDSGDSP